jgi:hypothetical protein
MERQSILTILLPFQETYVYVEISGLSDTNFLNSSNGECKILVRSDKCHTLYSVTVFCSLVDLCWTFPG